jgi:molybdopterin-binding protein
MPISARNKLEGRIVAIKTGDIVSHITIKVGKHLIESVIISQSAEEMNLKKGDTVSAVIKATEVMISKES